MKSGIALRVAAALLITRAWALKVRDIDDEGEVSIDPLDLDEAVWYSAPSSVSCGNHHASACAECTRDHDPNWCHGDCEWTEGECRQPPHIANEALIKALVQEYPFQPVRTEHGQLVDVVLVRSPFRTQRQRALYEKYKDKILFLGISSFEDYPLPPDNPFSEKFLADEYVGLFPGFLHMFREPEKVFPSHTKLLLMSQSDFALPPPERALPKEYDFVFSGTDQDVYDDCVGWSSFAKNWTFVKQSLAVMCGEYGMTGVLVATKSKDGSVACSIPESCAGKVTQTTFLDQGKFFDYVKRSHFAYVPQVHDASPRAAAQALALDTPVLMNWHIRGGWKYVNEKTGEFFHDMSDLRSSLDRIMHNLDSYEPRKYMTEHYGDAIAGAKLLQFVQENFGHRVKLPEGASVLFPAGA